MKSPILVVLTIVVILTGCNTINTTERSDMEVQNFLGKPGHPVPEVDSATLKKLWETRDVARGPGIAELEFPKTDLRAATYRVLMLGAIQLVAINAGKIKSNELTPEEVNAAASCLSSSEPSDSVFSVISSMPIVWPDPQSDQRPPFDFKEFARLCKGA